MHINPLTAIDFYKADHRRQYPEGTSEIYSNLTARAAHPVRKANGWHDNKVVFFANFCTALIWNILLYGNLKKINY